MYISTCATNKAVTASDSIESLWLIYATISFVENHYVLYTDIQTYVQINFKHNIYLHICDTML